jgi:hypothetical protein
MIITSRLGKNRRHRTTDHLFRVDAKIRYQGLSGSSSLTGLGLT